MKRLIPALTVLLSSMLLLAACSQMNVKHLNRHIWELETPRSLPMKFWRFDYRITPVSDQFMVRGEAMPVPDSIPEWAENIEDIWFAAYLSDKGGSVIAQDLRVFEPGPLDRTAGISFEFTLRPDALPTSGDLYITFGYRMKLAAGEEQPPGPGVFFASEGAMTRF